MWTVSQNTRSEDSSLYLHHIKSNQNIDWLESLFCWLHVLLIDTLVLFLEYKKGMRVQKIQNLTVKAQRTAAHDRPTFSFLPDPPPCLPCKIEQRHSYSGNPTPEAQEKRRQTWCTNQCLQVSNNFTIIYVITYLETMLLSHNSKK